jgi:hypothetical protein
VSTRDRAHEIASEVVASTSVPASLDGLSEADRKGLERMAAHRGITPEAALESLRASQESTAAADAAAIASEARRTAR